MLACLYYSGSREDSAAQIREALPYMDGADAPVALAALEKLDAMSVMEFSLVFREGAL